MGPRLGALVGLSRIGVNQARVPGGKESFIYHSHYREEEEWIYIVSGRAIAGMTARSTRWPRATSWASRPRGVAHHLRNPYDEDLIYLVGGEINEVEVADFPRLGKRMIRSGQGVEIYDTSDAKSFGPLEEEIGTKKANPSDIP